MNFNTGFYHNGRLVLDRCKIACNYMQGWLTFDLMLISLDVPGLVVPDLGAVFWLNRLVMRLLRASGFESKDSLAANLFVLQRGCDSYLSVWHERRLYS